MSLPETNLEIRLQFRPRGVPTKGNFEAVEVDVPSIGDGEILVQNEWISVDPYMRGRMNDSDSYVPRAPCLGRGDGRWLCRHSRVIESRFFLRRCPSPRQQGVAAVLEI